MSSASLKVTSLPVDVLHRAVVDLSGADLGRLSETNRLFARLTRRMRLRVFVMSPRSFSALEQWVKIGALYPEHCVCSEMDDVRTIIPICPTVQEDFGQHVKSIVLPKEWTSKTRALFVLLNRLAPAGLQSVTMLSNGSKEWWAGARLAWSGYDNGELFAPIQRLVLDRPNFVPFISLFSKEAPSTRLLLSRMPLTLILSGAPAEEDHEVEWGAGFGGGWAVNPAPAVQWTDEREKMVLRATHLDLEINSGTEQLLDTIFFFDLHSLDVRTPFVSDWTLVQRLLRDNRAQLKYLRIHTAGSRGLAEAIEPVFLGSLTSLHIDWEYLSVVRRMADSTVDGQVTLTIHKYVADYATDAEFGVAAEVLTMTHWAEIVVVEDEFWGTPDAIAGQAMRRADFVDRALMETPPTYVTNFV
ncbi:hypothetical protein FB107DRAFT_294761 [Schizophyllum commune]